MSILYREISVPMWTPVNKSKKYELLDIKELRGCDVYFCQIVFEWKFVFSVNLNQKKLIKVKYTYPVQKKNGNERIKDKNGGILRTMIGSRKE
jgi:hypothetical protein